MYGTIHDIAPNTLFVEGKEPKTILLEPDIASSVLYRAGDTLYLMDTGATLFFRKRLLEAAEMLRPFRNFVLLNSHGHPDHTPNNAIIHEIVAEEKMHFLSKCGFSNLNYVERSKRDFEAIAEFYDIEDGPGFPMSMLFQPLKLLRLINPAIIDRQLTSFIVKRVLKKFEPLEPSRETARPYEERPASTLRIGDVEFSGWDVNDRNEVYVLETRGHTPDSVSFYLPKVKILFLSDETVDYFNCWPDTNSGRIVQALEKALRMYDAGEVRGLIGGHQQTVYQGGHIPALLNRLLKQHRTFRKALREIVEPRSRGMTVKEVYRELRKRRGDPDIASYFNYEFPKMPGMLKTNITFALLEEGFVPVGRRGKKRFSKASTQGSGEMGV